MFQFPTKKIIGLALLASLVGCAGQHGGQSVVVAPKASPVAISGYQGKPYTGGQLVNNTPEVQEQAARLPSLIHFDFDSDQLKPQAIEILDQQAQFLSQNDAARVLVAGHTDERGSREYNISLGERRAAAVRAYLLTKGIEQARVEIISFGEERPLVEQSNEDAWSKNRRAELSY